MPPREDRAGKHKRGKLWSSVCLDFGTMAWGTPLLTLMTPETRWAGCCRGGGGTRGCWARLAWLSFTGSGCAAAGLPDAHSGAAALLSRVKTEHCSKRNGMF